MAIHFWPAGYASTLKPRHVIINAWIYERICRMNFIKPLSAGSNKLEPAYIKRGNAYLCSNTVIILPSRLMHNQMEMNLLIFYIHITQAHHYLG